MIEDGRKKRRLRQQQQRQQQLQARRPSGMSTLLRLALATVAIAQATGLRHLSSSSSSSSSAAFPAKWRGGAFGRGGGSTSGGELRPPPASAAATTAAAAETGSDAAGDAPRRNLNNATVEEYVAAMKERDGRGRAVTPTEDDEEEDDYLVDDKEDGGSGPSSSTSGGSSEEESSPSSSEPEEQGEASPDGGGDEDSSVVGVKAHSHHKKSNAVGDPDGDDDDDDNDPDDDEDGLSELSEEWEELAEFIDEFVDAILVEPQVQVEVELVEEDAIGDVDLEEAAEADGPATKGGGGVGVRLGRLGGRRRNSRRDASWKTMTHKVSQDQTGLVNAWLPYIYFPPTKTALTYLFDNARLLDASSKNRLDRRTLYAALLLEWGITDGKVSSRTRKFIPAPTSLALQAALSLATQPQWRQSAPRTSGIRLYQDDDATKGCTLGMQETVAMALVSTTAL